MAAEEVKETVEGAEQSAPEAEAVPSTEDCSKCSGSEADDEEAADAVPEAEPKATSAGGTCAGEGAKRVEGEARLEGLDQQVDEAPEEPDWKDKFMRLHADWDNYRKRMDEQRADERVRANERLITDLLPLIDDFKHAIDYAEKNGEGDLLDGVKAISSKFYASLEKNGLQEIDPAGEPFDPIFHQAVGTVEDTEAYDETVKDVYQKGYKLGIKVIRPAMVTITTGGEKRPKEEEKTEE